MEVWRAAGPGWTLDKAFERQSGPRSGPPGGDLSPNLPTLVAGCGVAEGNQEWVECKKEGERVGDSHRPDRACAVSALSASTNNGNSIRNPDTLAATFSNFHQDLQGGHINSILVRKPRLKLNTTIPKVMQVKVGKARIQPISLALKVQVLADVPGTIHFVNRACTICPTGHHSKTMGSCSG